MGTLKPVTVPPVERIKLSNGLTVALVPFGSVPQATLMLTTFAGDVDAPGRPWLAAINADLMKQGAGGKDARQLAEALSAMGGNLAASADANVTQVSATVLSERAGDAIALLADVVRRPNLAQADFDRVKSNRKRDLSQALASPQAMADVLMAKALVRRPSLWRADPDRGPARRNSASATSRHSRRPVRRRALDPLRHRQVRPRPGPRRRRKGIGRLEGGPARKMLPASFAGGPRVILADRAGSEQTTVRLAFDAPAVGGADDIPFRAADALLAGSFGSRITANIREDKGYTYSPYSTIGGRPGGATWTWNGDITPAVTGAAMTEVFKEIRRLQAEAPPPPKRRA